ncbi:multicopper oxidase family protein [Brevibacillus sp. SYP-B805]|uniref:multicopper oxidase family protein n=1 Tax=Brevibacillus sp. SYP-B805 TaxID=1578199 RepID=UPI0013EBDA67|nr:multicopper oxidase family protein [Brevibacillus sp. SYP-B805]NGQ96891.1 multicopper oxidase family protein [Brevibacillus sp. SYP-B805]
MFELFNAVEFLVLLALVFVWGLTGFAANRFKYAACHNGNVKRWSRLARIGIWAGEVLFCLWFVNMLLVLWLFGWLFVWDRLLVVLPVMALPALWVMRTSMPKLKQADSGHPASLVSIVAPIHTMLIGTMLAAYLVMFAVPAIPDATESTIYPGILLACAGLLWWYQQRRVEKIFHRQPGLAARLLRGTGIAAVLLTVALSGYTWSLAASKFPDTMEMVNHDAVDFGGGTAFAHASLHQGGGHSPVTQGNEAVSVAELTGPRTGVPDKRFTLHAKKQQIRLGSGRMIEAWTFNGQFPGPPLVVNKGDLVEVKLVNIDINQGVTLHWHGVDVPNAEDGVAGMTQDAVMPGESHTYRFVVNETGSHWYHSHQLSSIQVQKGLVGPFIILPENQKRSGSTLDLTTFAHDWATPEGTVTTLDAADTLQRKAVKPGTEVRLRLVNASSETKMFTLNGTAYKVAAIDGNDIHEPGALTDSLLRIGGGGRFDVIFTMPETPVTLALYDENTEVGIVFSKDGQGKAEPLKKGTVFDPTSYGTPAPSPFGPLTVFDRQFTLILDQLYVGNYDGKTAQLWAINGEVFPDTPTLMVEKGDIVKTTFVNRSWADHPLHLHGHHLHVLRKNGKPISGSPLVLDTLLIDPGEMYEVAFAANNPGLWMDHCHNLEHASLGMTMHLAYRNVTTPFVLGGKSGNHPE